MKPFLNWTVWTVLALARLQAQEPSAPTPHAAAKLREPGVAQQLPEVVVTANANPAPSLTNASPEAAQAELSRVAGGTNLVKAEDYRRGRASTLQDVLGFQPGVFAVSRFGSEEARISIRGSGLQRTFHGRGIKILQDGLSLNEADGSFDMQAFEPLAYRYIEVFRGANALEYGASTLGGAINFVTPTGHDSSLAQIRGETGSFDTWRGQLSSGHVAGPFDYYGSLSHSSAGGYRDFSQQNNQRFLGNLGWRIAENAETRFYLNHAKSDSELPGSLTKAQMEADPRQAAAGNMLRGDKRDFDYVRVANKTTLVWDENKLEAGVFWAYKDLDHPIFNVLTPFFATGPGVIDLETNNYGGDLKFTHSGEVFGRRNRLTVGITPTAATGNDNRFENLDGTYDRGQKFADGTEEVFNTEFYFENELYLGEKLALILGHQFTYANRDYTDHFPADGDSTDDQDYFGFSPKLGLRYDFTPESNAFFNLSRSYEPPSFGELKTITASAGGPVFPNRLPSVTMQNLEAQSATTLEIGTRGSWNRLGWDLACYHAWVDNELLSLNDANGAPLGTINATSTRHQGVEAGFAVRLAENLLARGGTLEQQDSLTLRQVYNWSKFEFDSDPVFGSNPLAGLPEHFHRAELLYEHPCGFYFGPNVEWIMIKTPIDHANTFYADPYALLGLHTGYKSKKGFSVFAEAKNLTDKEYAATTGVIANTAGADSAQFNPGEGISFYGGLEWRY